MSSTKRLKLQNYCKSNADHRRQSFDERICDDLSEVILQYLSLKDKLKLECVSKQFQRSVFQKVYRIDVDIARRKNGFSLSTLESVLKKCPQINSLVYKLFVNNYYKKHIIDLILKYCNNLVEIDCNSVEMFEHLVEIFDKKLVNLNNPEYYKNNFNVKQIDYKSLSHINELSIISKYLQLYRFDGVNNLKSVSFCVYPPVLPYFKGFVENNQKLKYLEIKCIELDSNKVIILLNQISKLKHLIDLQIWTTNGLNEIEFKEGVKQIELNCQQLKSFGFRFNFVSNNCPKINEFLTPFKSMKRLNIEFIEENTYEMFSFELFKGCKDITHLSLKFNIWPHYSTSETILTNIDKYLPKLQFLDFWNKISLKSTDSLANILSGLPKLQSLKLVIISKDKVEEDANGFTTKSIKNLILNKCKNVNNILITRK